MASQSEITFELLDGTQAAEHADEVRALRAEELRGWDDDGSFANRFPVLRRQPGFVLAEARHGGYLVGYAFGMPLRPSTSWWRHLTTPLPDEVITEHPGRTFALVELLVRASWRRQGIAETLHDLTMANRPEERATLTVPPSATPAQQAFRKWGWRKVARTRNAEPGSPVSDVLMLTLPPVRLGTGRPSERSSIGKRPQATSTKTNSKKVTLSAAAAVSTGGARGARASLGEFPGQASRWFEQPRPRPAQRCQFTAPPWGTG